MNEWHGVLRMYRGRAHGDLVQIWEVYSAAFPSASSKLAVSLVQSTPHETIAVDTP